jgi:hypothetical protein
MGPASRYAADLYSSARVEFMLFPDWLGLDADLHAVDALTARQRVLSCRIMGDASFDLVSTGFPASNAKGPWTGPFDIHTASFAALTGRALTILRAGLALNIIGSPLKGFVPLRALVAGFLMTTNLAKPGTRKTLFFFSSL